MQHWAFRLLSAAGLVASLHTAALAGPPPGPVEAGHHDYDGYRAATPYNATVIGRPLPSPQLNFPNFILCCELPNQNLDPYEYSGNQCGCRSHGGRGRGCNDGCGRECGAIFQRHEFGRCHERGHRSCGGCDSGCDNPCRAIFHRHDFGCRTSCGCSAKAAPTDSGIQTVGFWAHTKKDPAPVPACESCPTHGPAPRHHLPTGANLGCTGCSTWESEAVFIFGSCRQFFGEPTHDWMHRGR